MAYIRYPAATSASVSFPLTASNGTAGAPSYSFSSDPTTGWYFTTGAINGSISGTKQFSLKSRNLQLGDGTTNAFFHGQSLDTSSIQYSGGLDTSSSILEIYGKTHASFPNWFQFSTATASSHGTAIGSIGTWSFGNGGSEDTTSLIRMINANNLTGTNQQGVLLTSLGNISATSSLSHLMIDFTTPNLSFTTTGVHGIKIRDSAKGASHTVTNYASVAIAAQSMTVAGSRVGLLVGCTDGVVLSPSVAGNYNSFFDGTGVNYFKGGLKSADNILTATDNSLAIGSSAARWSQVYALNFISMNSAMTFQTGSSPTTGMTIDQSLNVAMNNAAIATNATDGFLYIASCAGTPTGVPTAKTGRVAIVYDTSANKIWFYNGSWRGVVVA